MLPVADGRKYIYVYTMYKSRKHKDQCTNLILYNCCISSLKLLIKSFTYSWYTSLIGTVKLVLWWQKAKIKTKNKNVNSMGKILKLNTWDFMCNNDGNRVAWRVIFKMVFCMTNSQKKCVVYYCFRSICDPHRKSAVRPFPEIMQLSRISSLFWNSHFEWSPSIINSFDHWCNKIRACYEKSYVKM